MTELRTARLRLRAWEPRDLEPFAAMNADPRVMEHFPALVTRDETAAMIERIERHWREHGFGLWALEVPSARPEGEREKAGASFIGFAGLSHPPFDTPFTPCVEIGWRLAADHWGHGYATEAARAAIQFGFDTLGLAEIVSFTIAANTRSQRVMEKLGMRRDHAGDFEHPRLPVGHPLRPHILYRLRATP